MDKNQQLTERNKELNCLYEIDKLGFNSNELHEYFKSLINIIQNGFQYVSFLKVQIKYKNHDYKSPHFSETKHFLKENLSANNKLIGSITVFYSSEKLKSDEPFLEEEERLLFSIARRVGDFLFIYENTQHDQPNKNNKSKTLSNSKLRFNLVSDLCSAIDLKPLGIIAIYLIGSTKDNTAGKKSDIDLIIHYDGNKSSLIKIKSWLFGWESSKKREIREFFEAKESSIFDLHFITDKDIQEQDSYASMIDSHTNRAKLLKKR